MRQKEGAVRQRTFSLSQCATQYILPSYIFVDIHSLANAQNIIYYVCQSLIIDNTFAQSMIITIHILGVQNSYTLNCIVKVERVCIRNTYALYAPKKVYATQLPFPLPAKYLSTSLWAAAVPIYISTYIYI